MTRQSAPTIQVGAIDVRFLVDASDSAGSVTVFECGVPGDAIMPMPHSHDGFEETIFGLEGITTWTVDGRSQEVAPGDAVCIPRGAIHGFQNAGSTTARFLAIATPGVFGPDYFTEMGAVIAASAGGPPDRAAIGEVMRRHGLTPVQAG